MASNHVIPPKTLTIESGEVLTMSYGMFTDIMRLMGDSEDAVSMLMGDSNVRDWVVRRLFTKAQKPIESADDLINPFDMDVNPLEQSNIIAWVADHVMHFTVSTAEQTRPVVVKYQERLQAVSSSLSKTGSED
jgi:hypothetical protein